MRNVTALIGIAIVTACAVSAPIQPVSTSKSAFDGALYKGTTVAIAQAHPGTESYRVFIQGATGFVSMQSLRDDAEQRATAFCDRKGAVMESLVETTANPPYIMGNFPRIEIVFDCSPREVETAVADGPGENQQLIPKYQTLTYIKGLLDRGVLTQGEFDAEKAKILAQP